MSDLNADKPGDTVEETSATVEMPAQDGAHEQENSGGKGEVRPSWRQLSFRRKKRQVHDSNGHQFRNTHFKQPTFCSHCDKFMWGMWSQGYQCKACRVVVHKHCHNQVIPYCPSLTEQSADSHPHTLEVSSYYRPTYCHHCGSLLYGLTRQGLHCQACKMNFHKRCEKHVAQNCAPKGATEAES